MSKTFLILGGYGNTGKLIADFLLKHTDSKLIIAGRDRSKAEKTARFLNQKYFDERTKALRIDAANKKYLSEKFLSSDLIITASSTAEYSRNIIEAAIEAGKDYLDIQLSSEKKLSILKSYERKIKENGLLFMTDCGFHPGIPAIMARYAGERFEKLEIANIGSLINIDWKDLVFSESTILEMVDEFISYKPLIFRNKQWEKTSFKDYKKFDFDFDFKKITCVPMMLEEMKALPNKYPTLRETGFYVTGFNPFVNYFIIPVGSLAIKIIPGLARKPFARSFEWGLKKFSKPPYRTVLVLSAIGRQAELTKELRIKISHADGYWLTAASVSALLFQYVRGSFKQPGVFLQGHLANPDIFFKDLEMLGVNVSIKN